MNRKEFWKINNWRVVNDWVDLSFDLKRINGNWLGLDDWSWIDEFNLFGCFGI